MEDIKIIDFPFELHCQYNNTHEVRNAKPFPPYNLDEYTIFAQIEEGGTIKRFANVYSRASNLAALFANSRAMYNLLIKLYRDGVFFGDSAVEVQSLLEKIADDVQALDFGDVISEE